MISVCIATYNGENYIQAQLNSIIPQLSADDEIIISDDGSTDKTIEIIRSYYDKRIKVLTHKEHNNSYKYPLYKTAKNIENALNQANGDLIFLADQDDIWSPNKVQIVTQEMGLSLGLLHDCIIINEEDEELFPSYYQLNKSRLGIISNIINCSYLGCCMVLRKELLKTALPFPAIPVPHDIWLGLLVEWRGEMRMSDKKLVYYRRHNSNQSSSSEKSNFSFLFKIRYRLYILLAFTCRVLFKR